jgi:hypothetical protein
MKKYFTGMSCCKLFRKKHSLVASPVLVITAMLLFSSCITSKKIDSWIGEKYQSALPIADVNNDSISINLRDTVLNKDKVSLTKKRSSFKLPLLFYWKWHSNHFVNVNENIAFSKFSQSFLYYANLNPLKTKLSGKKLELNIVGLPHIFTIDDEGWMGIPILYYFGNEKFTVKPYKKKMVVQYKLFEGVKLKKSGVISIPNTDLAYQQYFLYSPKSMTNDYLTQYDENLTKMSKVFVDKLIEELFVYGR